MLIEIRLHITLKYLKDYSIFKNLVFLLWKKYLLEDWLKFFEDDFMYCSIVDYFKEKVLF